MPLFTNAQIGDLQLKAEEIMSDGILSAQYIAHAEAARAVLENQTIEIKELSDPNKDRTVLVKYIDTCALVDETCPTDYCDFSSTELATKSKEFDLPLCRSAGYAIDENDVAKSIYGQDEAVVKGQLTAKKKLDEYVSKQVLLALNANSGVNNHAAPYTYNGANATTYIPDANYNRKIVPYFEKMGIMHQIDSPYYIDNGALWMDWRNAQLDAGNADGRGDKARIDAVKMYFDMRGFVAAGVAPDDTFLVGKHAVGIASKVYNPNQYRLVSHKSGTQARWTEDSSNLPGVKYDVYYQIECRGKRFLHSWKYVFNGGIFIQPEGCEAGVTGIMSFTAGVAP